MEPVVESGGRRKGKVVVASLLALAVFATAARAELTARGNLFARFSGGITPTALPRMQRIPIAVSVAGTVKTFTGERPPALRQVRIELNRGGRLDPDALPACHYRQLADASPGRALASCGDSLVGGGFYSAMVAFPEQGSVPLEGRILAFNAVYEGHHAILAHVYGGEPAPIAHLIVFRIRHQSGTFGTVLTGDLPPSINNDGYVTGISLRFFRHFAYRGSRRTYISASCAAPRGFSVGVFPFARASMSFEDGRTLSSVLTRTCRVSDPGGHGQDHKNHVRILTNTN